LLLYKINAILPASIVVTDICAVSPDAHARFDALSRTYNYYVHTIKEPFLTDFSYFFPYQLDIESMNRAAALLIGEMDFTSMAKLHSDVKTNICNVTEALWTPGSPLNTLTPAGLTNSYCFTISANRFLRNMVRAIVGSLLEIGRGRRQPEWITQLLSQKDRSAAGNSVPAHALYLTKIEYPYKIF
jgi:tRNA pseudouridine38-40 synthase